MATEPRAYDADQLEAGMAAEFDREVTAEDVLTFAANSGDRNPLHVDAGYAERSNYRGRIVHGAFQVGLASAMAGMHLPGRSVLLGSINARFPSPLYYPCRVHVRGEITAWSRANLAGQLRVVVSEATTRVPTAEIAMGFTLHEGSGARHEPASPSGPGGPGPRAGRGVVLVTGAAGGLGAAIAADLARDVSVCALVHRQPLDDNLKALPNVRELRVDLSMPGWADAVAEVLGGEALFGVVHAAWPGMPRGGLLQVADDVLDLQLAFGASHAVRLARLLFARADPDRGGRFIAIGSIAGAQKPTIAVAAYSLGKAALEATVRLLAPELARKKITVNAVCPSLVPVGMNRQADDRQLKAEAARIPLGRPCLPADVVGAVRYLLSPEASFVSGQVLGLTGGLL